MAESLTLFMLGGAALNELLIELAGVRLFDQVWGIPPYEDHYRKSDGYISAALAKNRLFNRMKDCEIVLRFFAFREEQRIRGSVRSILDTYMEENRYASSDQLDQLRQIFVKTLTTAHDVFGEHTFRIRSAKNNKSLLSLPLFDAVMVAIEKLAGHQGKLVANRDKIIDALSSELNNPDVYDIIVGKPNTATAIKNRISIVHNLLKSFI